LNLDRIIDCCRREPLPGPAAIAIVLTAEYAQWLNSSSIDLVALADAFNRSVTVSNTPICQACLQVAEAVMKWGGHPYHSVCHHAEVATNAMVIGEIAGRLNKPLHPHQRSLLLAASLAHDLYYDPSRTDAEPFQLEAASARALDGIAEQCRVHPQDRAILTSLILATEPSFRSELRLKFNGRVFPAKLPDGLEPIVTRPDITELAAMLSDADLLSSAGLTLQWHQIQTLRFEHETGSRLSPSADLQFLNSVVGPGFLSAGARHFDSNLANLRATITEAVG
jgi:hypothetical protein